VAVELLMPVDLFAIFPCADNCFNFLLISGKRKLLTISRCVAYDL